MADEEAFVDVLRKLTGGNDSFIGDDCAVLPFGDSSLLATVDSLVGSIHVSEQAELDEIAEKLVRVNLSDIAAMGGDPLWALLSEGSNLSFKEREFFAETLVDVLGEFDLDLVGGDLAGTGEGCSPFYSLTVIGQTESGSVLRRNKAKSGDRIGVTGDLGGHRAALSNLDKGLTTLDKNLLYRPDVRLELAREFVNRGFECAIDLSDGLLKDLERVCTASSVGARINWKDLPIHSLVRDRAVDDSEALEWALTGGEDYELLVAIPEELEDNLPREVQIIGTFTDSTGIEWEPELPDGLGVQQKGYDHLK